MQKTVKAWLMNSDEIWTVSFKMFAKNFRFSWQFFKWCHLVYKTIIRRKKIKNIDLKKKVAPFPWVKISRKMHFPYTKEISKICWSYIANSQQPVHVSGEFVELRIKNSSGHHRGVTTVRSHAVAITSWNIGKIGKITQICLKVILFGCA